MEWITIYWDASNHEVGGWLAVREAASITSMNVLCHDQFAAIVATYDEAINDL